MDQLILILLQQSADHSSPALGLEPAKKDLNRQGLAVEPLSSSGPDEEVENQGILETEIEGDNIRDG